jgi:hypothetical protein
VGWGGAGGGGDVVLPQTSAVHGDKQGVQSRVWLVFGDAQLLHGALVGLWPMGCACHMYVRCDTRYTRLSISHHIPHRMRISNMPLAVWGRPPATWGNVETNGEGNDIHLFAAARPKRYLVVLT